MGFYTRVLGLERSRARSILASRFRALVCRPSVALEPRSDRAVSCQRRDRRRACWPPNVASAGGSPPLSSTSHPHATRFETKNAPLPPVVLNKNSPSPRPLWAGAQAVGKPQLPLGCLGRATTGLSTDCAAVHSTPRANLHPHGATHLQTHGARGAGWSLTCGSLERDGHVWIVRPGAVLGASALPGHRAARRRSACATC